MKLFLHSFAGWSRRCDSESEWNRRSSLFNERGWVRPIAVKKELVVRCDFFPMENSPEKVFFQLRVKMACLTYLSGSFTNDFLKFTHTKKPFSFSFGNLLFSYFFPHYFSSLLIVIAVLKCLRLATDPVTLELKRGKVFLIISALQ